MKWIPFVLLLGAVCSCRQAPAEQQIIIVLIKDGLPSSEKQYLRDGIYTLSSNNGMGNLVYLYYANEVHAYFLEDTVKRKQTAYYKAFEKFKEEYERSYYTALPTDFVKRQVGKRFDIVVLDTINKKAFMSNMSAITVMK